MFDKTFLYITSGDYVGLKDLYESAETDDKSKKIVLQNIQQAMSTALRNLDVAIRQGNTALMSKYFSDLHNLEATISGNYFFIQNFLVHSNKYH